MTTLGRKNDIHEDVMEKTGLKSKLQDKSSNVFSVECSVSFISVRPEAALIENKYWKTWKQFGIKIYSLV